MKNYRRNRMNESEMEIERQMEMEREAMPKRTPQEQDEIKRLALALSTGDYSDVEDLIEESYDEEHEEHELNHDRPEDNMSAKEKADLKILIKALETGDYAPAMHLLADEEMVGEGKNCDTCVSPSTGKSKRKKISKFSDFKK
jgi:hypothetical protein